MENSHEENNVARERFPDWHCRSRHTRKCAGHSQTVEITKVDVQKVAAGYRASKVIGSSVVNDANETIGKIDDLLVTRDGKEL